MRARTPSRDWSWPLDLLVMVVSVSPAAIVLAVGSSDDPSSPLTEEHAMQVLTPFLAARRLMGNARCEAATGGSKE